MAAGDTTACSTPFTVTADTGYTIASVTGCGGSLSGTTYTTGAVTADCAVEAQFSLRQYSLTATAGEGGSVNPASQAIGHGLTAQFEVTAAEGYEIASVTGCGGSLSGNTYTTGPVTADCAVEASFSVSDPVTVSTAATEGVIFQPEAITVARNQPAVIQLALVEGYLLEGITGCNGSFDSDSYEYRIPAVSDDCTLTAAVVDTYSIRVTGSVNFGEPLAHSQLVLMELQDGGASQAAPTVMTNGDGTFVIRANQLDPDAWYVLYADGGQVANDEGQLGEGPATLKSSPSMLVKGADLLSGEPITLSLLTDVVAKGVGDAVAQDYQGGREGLAASLDYNAGALVNDVNGDGVVTYADVLSASQQPDELRFDADWLMNQYRPLLFIDGVTASDFLITHDLQPASASGMAWVA